MTRGAFVTNLFIAPPVSGVWAVMVGILRARRSDGNSVPRPTLCPRAPAAQPTFPS